MRRRDFLKTIPAAAGAAVAVVEGVSQLGQPHGWNCSTTRACGCGRRGGSANTGQAATSTSRCPTKTSCTVFARRRGHRSREAARRVVRQGQQLGLGQWLSGMARMYRATGDTEIRDKAVRLFTEWAKTSARTVTRGWGTIRSTSWCAASSISSCMPAQKRRAPCWSAYGACSEDVRARQAAARGSVAQPALLRAAPGAVHARENLYRAYGSPATASTGNSATSGSIARTGRSSRTRRMRRPTRTAFTPTAT